MLDGVSNVRDVGGIPAQGGTISHGVLLRSATLASLTELGRQQLAELRVDTVVDLRTEAEQRDAPDDLPGVRLVALPVRRERGANSAPGNASTRPSSPPPSPPCPRCTQA